MTRKSTKPTALSTVAFFVRDDAARLLVETLAQKVIAKLQPGASPVLRTVRLMGSPQLMGVLSGIQRLMGDGYERFIVVFDTGTKDKRRISSILEEIQRPLIQGFVLNRVALIPVVPSIERWVLVDTEALERALGKPLPEELSRKRGRPEALLRELFGEWGPKEQKRVARYLDPERIRARDASFEAFTRALQAALGGHAHSLPEEWEPVVT